MNYRLSDTFSLRRNLRIGTFEGMMATPWLFMTIPGNFIMAALLTQVFGIDKGTYGWIVAIPSVLNAVQIVLVPWLMRFLSPKELTVGMGWFNLGLWVILVQTLPYLSSSDTHGGARFFVYFFLFSSLSAALLGIGWTAWVRSWVPRRVQGRYFGTRNRWMSFCTVGLLVFVMILFERSAKAIWPYQALFAVTAGLRFLSLLWQNTIHSPSDQMRPQAVRWQEQLASCRRAKGLILFIVYSAFISFWISFVGPFLPVFCFEKLDFTPGQFSILVLLSTASAMLGWSFWGRFADRLGSIPLLLIGLLLWEIPALFLLFITQETAWTLYPIWIWSGFVSVSYWMGSFNLLLNLLPTDARVFGSSLNLAFTSVAAAVAPIIAGGLLQHFLAQPGGGDLVYRIGFGLKSCAVLSSLFAIRLLHEPSRSGRASAPGAFTTLRLILSNVGPAFLATVVPQRSRTIRKDGWGKR